LGEFWFFFYTSLGNIDSPVVISRILNPGKEDAFWVIKMKFWLNEDEISDK